MYSPAGVTVGLILIAVGAILVWAVSADAEGVNINAVGWILMIVGAAAALLSAIFWAGWSGPRGYRRREYVEGDAHRRPRRRREVVEEDEVGPGPPPP